MVTALAARESIALTLSGICSVSADMVSVAGATIVLMGVEALPVAIFSSDPAFDQLEDLQFTLGIGPGIDAFRAGEPVIEADLVNEPPDQWPGYADQAIRSGVRAVFSFPLQIGAARSGVLTFYQLEPGSLHEERYADALIMAGVATRSILDLQAGASDGALAAGLASGHVDHADVHQASGMISVQLDIGVGEALARLRAHAFAEGRDVHHVAREVLARRLRLFS
jgi:hypothetical protein